MEKNPFGIAVRAAHPAGGAKLLRRLHCFVVRERGDAPPITYLIGLLLAAMLVMFTIDTGVRRAGQLEAEYAAQCAARAAAIELPRGDREGACRTSDEEAAIRREAAACLASLTSGTVLHGHDPRTQLVQMLRRAESRVQLRITDANGQAPRCFRHHEIVQVEVTYRHDLTVPLSPWSLVPERAYRSRAQAMLQTRK